MRKIKKARQRFLQSPAASGRALWLR